MDFAREWLLKPDEKYWQEEGQKEERSLLLAIK